MVWAKDNRFREGRYDLFNRNCEHLANMVVYGINYSKQVEDSNLANIDDGIGTFASGFSNLSVKLFNFGNYPVRCLKNNNDKAWP